MIIGFTCSAFDLLHPGHLYMLEECKEHCDFLIVGLHTDPTIDRPDTKTRPVQSTYERYVQLKSCIHVDDIIPYDTEKDLVNILAYIPLNIRFVGEEYRNIEYTGKQVCIDRNIDIYYNKPRLYNYSSSELRSRLK